ncbi:MAG: excinuclease ABC subunit UvrC [Syntrophaceae bacterium]|nr:excinuclease ABC subunit UvrC [Syntrophaceae bacterium]
MPKKNKLKEKTSKAPRSPGVYLMKDAQGKIIYIGKANNLRSRINSYFTGKDTRPMAPFLMARVSDIEFITTATEKEALILENNLIKKHRPRYNVVLRDDKTYYHLSLDPTEKYPRLQLARKRVNNAALYFGPYPSGIAAKETLRFVQQVFPLRSCRNRDFKLRARPCLEYQIGRCLAPCGGMVGEEDYRKLVDSTVLFLKGRSRELISGLKKQMDDASNELNYEEAARLRDRIGALEHSLEKQNVDYGAKIDQDIVGYSAEDNNYQLCILFIRGGKLLGSKSFMPIKLKTDIAEVISSCLTQYYHGESDIPEEIIMPVHFSDENIIAQWLSEKKGKKVTLIVPSRGAKNALLDMANDNARSLWEAANKKEENKMMRLETLKEKLSLSKLPRCIECYDISNIGGKHAVGSMVVFQDGEPDKTSYRRYRIKTLNDPDDYGMMHEVLSRRFKGKDAPPDLLIVDGGKGQLNIALSVCRDLKVKIDTIGLAKEERAFISTKGLVKKKLAKTEDRVYLSGRKDPIFLTSLPSALALLQRVRDEAHRFALRYHRQLKQKSDLKSALDEISDIGSKRKTALLKHFGSVKKVKGASLEDLQDVPGISKKLAQKIYKELANQ